MFIAILTLVVGEQDALRLTANTREPRLHAQLESLSGGSVAHEAGPGKRGDHARHYLLLAAATIGQPLPQQAMPVMDCQSKAQAESRRKTAGPRLPVQKQEQ